jgi:hypothetical protein
MQRHRQLVTAAARAQVGCNVRTSRLSATLIGFLCMVLRQERVGMLERELKHSQDTSQRAQGELRLLHGRQSEVLAPAAVRAVVRDALKELADGFVPAPAYGEHDELLAAFAELVRVELTEGLALEDSGWCRCPPLPDLPSLCRAIASVSRASGGDRRQGDDVSGDDRFAGSTAVRLIERDACAAETARLQDGNVWAQQQLFACEDDLELCHRQLQAMQRASPPPPDDSRCAPFVR